MRFLYVKGAMPVVFPCFGYPGCEWAGAVNVLRNWGAPESLLRVTAALWRPQIASLSRRVVFAPSS
jgi:hypothetical protein